MIDAHRLGRRNTPAVRLRPEGVDNQGALLHTFLHTYMCVYIDIYTHLYIPQRRASENFPLHVSRCDAVHILRSCPFIYEGSLGHRPPLYGFESQESCQYLAWVKAIWPSG